MLNVMKFIFNILQKFISTLNNTVSPITGISLGALYFGLILAGLISYILFFRILRGEKSE